MTTGSHKHAPPGDSAGKSADPAKSDAFVDRLGDRLSGQHDLPPEPTVAAPPRPVERPPTQKIPFPRPPAPPKAPFPPSLEASSPSAPAHEVLEKFPAAHEASDVHTLPGGPGEDDEALDVPPPPAGDTGDAFAEFEDELEGENTRLDDSHLLAEQSTAIIEDLPKQPFLAVEKGNDFGREFVLQEGENGIGRGIDNDVILADVAVSRRHLKIIREGDRLTLKDLGSGNGSQVNGEKISSVQLVEGDRIDVGETTLVVRIPGASLSAVDPYDTEGVTDEANIGSTLPPPGYAMTPSDPFAVPPGPGYQPELTPSATSAPGPARAVPASPRGAVVLPKPVFLAIIAAGALLLAMMGAAVALLAIRSGSSEEESVTLAGETGPFERGVAAYQAHRWDEAETAFREAASADEPNPQVSVYLGRIGEARQHQELITAARTALAAGEDNVALSRVTSVPETSPLASEAQAVASEAGGRIVRAEVAAGRHALQEQRDTQEARNHLENARNHLQQARSPEANRLVQALEAELSGQAGAGAAAVVVPPTAPTAHEPDPEPEEDPEPEPDRHEDREPAGRRSTGRTATTVARRGRSSGRDASGGTSSAERTAITAYLAGRFDQAATAARSAASSASGTERRRLEGMASAIGQFAPLWNRVRSVRTPNPSQRRDMERAIALDERIARNPQYRNQLRDRVVEAYLTEARRQRSSPTASCTAVRSALRLQGSNADARRMAADCEVQARGMLRAAQTAPATRQVALCRQILSMVPASSPVARDANQLMSRARRQTSFDEDE